MSSSSTDDDLDPFTSLLASAFYSPFYLRHLPQPIPKDLPPGLDSSIYSFADAYEDLLLVSQGYSLPKIEKRHEITTFVHRLFPAGEPPVPYIRRLLHSDLLRQQQPRPDWKNFHRQLGSLASEVWGRSSASSEAQDVKKQSVSSEAQDIKKQSVSSEVQDDKQSSRLPPNNFDDLFDSILSKNDEGPKAWRSWDALCDYVGGRRSPPKQRDQDMDTLMRFVTGDVASGLPPQELPKETTRYRTQTIVRPVVDQYGNVVTHMTSVRLELKTEDSGASDKPHESKTGPQEGRTSEPQETKTSKKSGWFWN
ncbi:hypothetical protein CP533_0959 [Ophiocordyceps camponoti-saundersi (nom. inval.)]|nr:hypothetical protein CP533_0959 [Ophiocordyceps camponoti-saundersi (nom. inval.)]